MTQDHAKALADALLKCRANHGMEFSAGLMAEVCDALANYDASQMNEAADKLSTHQQQGAENGEFARQLIEKFGRVRIMREVSDAGKFLCDKGHRDARSIPALKVVDYLVEYALSRAPQPDTVPVNMPFKRVPVCACDPGSGEPPSKQTRMKCKIAGGPCAEKPTDDAPQPDTVTDVREYFCKMHDIPDLEGYLKATHGMVPAEWTFDALTSALAVRGKI